VVRGEELYYRNRALDAIKRAAAARGFELCVHDAKDSAFQAQCCRTIYAAERCSRPVA
jgi:hypothetical protein